MPDRRQVRIITSAPIVVPLTNIVLDPSGVTEMARWVAANRPECLPPDLFADETECREHDEDMFETEVLRALFPHDGYDTDPFYKFRTNRDLASGFYEGPEERMLWGPELLPELAGRKCYDSFGLKAGRKSNAEYLKHVLTSSPPHASIFYHVHLTFFLADVSRRVSQEMFRNYVGHAADHEGSPSQESTRYTEHHGAYVAHPWDIDNALAGMTAGLETYARDCEALYHMFMRYVESEMVAWRERAAKKLEAADDKAHPNAPLNQADTGVRRRLYEEKVKMPVDVRKAILGSAAQRHGWGFATSFIWTANPIALIKLFKERDHAAADPEFRRLAHTWKRVCVMQHPNLFPMFIEEILAELEAEATSPAKRVMVHVGQDIRVELVPHDKTERVETYNAP